MQIEEKQIVINGQNIILRSPKKQDAETFSEVRDITYRETYFLARYPEETDFTAEAAEAMISDIAERREEFLIGAFRKEQMIGCVMVLKEGNHIKFRHKAGIGIFILQRYCGIGLGRQLMEYAIENARKTELEQLKLGVFDDNVAAIRLYEKLGFREWGREPHATEATGMKYRWSYFYHRKGRAMKLYFVRHGETEWNVKKKIQGKTDIPLNENGIRQAKELACQLVEEDISVKHVYHSPQLRAAETARIAAEALHATCIPLDGLVEMNLGSWEGSNWRVIERENSPEYQEWRKDRRYVRTPGGGECYNDVVKRTLDAMEYIMKRENGDVLIVTHSAIIMALRCYIAGLPFDEMVRKFKTRNAEVVMIESFKIIDAIARFKKENK